MNERHCTGDCMNCHAIQRALCASQMSYYNMRMLETLSKDFFSLKESVDKVNERVEALQNNEATLFNPVGEAQSGDGADE